METWKGGDYDRNTPTLIHDLISIHNGPPHASRQTSTFSTIIRGSPRAAGTSFVSLLRLNFP